MKILKFSDQNMNEVYANHWFEFFPILWDDVEYKYVRVEKSKSMGMVDPENGEIIKLQSNPEEYGKVKEI